MPRLGQSSVQSDLADQNFEFYVRRGTFGDINGGNDIEIPSDVRISTGDPNGAIYLTDPVTLAAGDSREFFSARSLAPGSVSNAPAGVFNRHNFTGYTRPGPRRRRRAWPCRRRPRRQKTTSTT